MSGTRLTFHNVVVCDDIRREQSGKDILVGAYGGAIVVPGLPATLSLAVWSQATPSEQGELTIKFRWLNPQDVQLAVVETKLQVSDTEVGAFAVPPLGMQFQSEGTIKVQVKQNNDEWQTIYSVPLKIGKIGF